jgi:hypothetical protein
MTADVPQYCCASQIPSGFDLSTVHLPQNFTELMIKKTSTVALSTIHRYLTSDVLQIMVKQPHYRPGEALKVPGGRGSQISRQSAHEGGKVVRSKPRPPLLLRKYTWYSFLLEVESTPGP